MRETFSYTSQLPNLFLSNHKNKRTAELKTNLKQTHSAQSISQYLSIKIKVFSRKSSVLYYLKEERFTVQGSVKYELLRSLNRNNSKKNVLTRICFFKVAANKTKAHYKVHRKTNILRK